MADTSPSTWLTKLSKLLSPASQTGTRSEVARATTHLLASSLSPNSTILEATTPRAVASVVALAWSKDQSETPSKVRREVERWD